MPINYSPSFLMGYASYVVSRASGNLQQRPFSHLLKCDVPVGIWGGGGSDRIEGANRSAALQLKGNQGLSFSDNSRGSSAIRRKSGCCRRTRAIQSVRDSAES